MANTSSGNGTQVIVVHRVDMRFFANEVLGALSGFFILHIQIPATTSI
jgi:hypothetical protein